MKRFPLLVLVLGALMALAVPAPASAQTTPVADISPELGGVQVDGFDYRIVKAQYDQVSNDLSAASSLVASSASELTDLQFEDTRLTTQLATETEHKKEALIATSQARAGLKALAIETYVQGQPDATNAALTVDVGAATRVLDRRTLTQAVSEEQSAKLRAATDELDQAEKAMTAALVSRTNGRQRMATVQATHDKAAADENRLTNDLVTRQAELARARVTATVVNEDFALVALDAYWKASKAMALEDPGCGIPWWALAGITRSESRHGTYGGAQLLANGDVNRVIVGIPLDGTNNTEVIPDTDGGVYDGDPVYDRAVGPMQFIPSTWVRWQRDGNGDRQMNPNNIYDAALAAAHYLCASGPMQTDDEMRRGFLSYNHSDAYATTVLNYAKGYSQFQIVPHQ